MMVVAFYCFSLRRVCFPSKIIILRSYNILICCKCHSLVVGICFSSLDAWIPLYSSKNSAQLPQCKECTSLVSQFKSIFFSIFVENWNFSKYHASSSCDFSPWVKVDKVSNSLEISVRIIFFLLMIPNELNNECSSQYRRFLSHGW